MNKDPKGSNVELTIKSSRSRIPDPGPKGWICERTLKPNRQGRERTMMTKQLMMVAFFLVTWCASIQKLTMFSNTAMRVLKAAKLMNIKNRVPQILPPLIWLKMLGRVMKSKEGPPG
jgi:hypothetical protein